MSGFNYLKVLDYRIFNNKIENIENILEKFIFIIPVNIDVIYKLENDDDFKRNFLDNDQKSILLLDSQILKYLNNIFFPKKFISKISGSDLLPYLCSIESKSKYRIFLLGGINNSAELAMEKLNKKYPNKVVGAISPSMGFEKNHKELEAINKKINESKANILFVGFGAPKQEIWAFKNYKYLEHIDSIICSGASIDFQSGHQKRAPELYRKLGLEWFYRFLHNPKRLFKRYFIEGMQVIFKIIVSRFRNDL